MQSPSDKCEVSTVINDFYVNIAYTFLSNLDLT